MPDLSQQMCVTYLFCRVFDDSTRGHSAFVTPTQLRYLQCGLWVFQFHCSVAAYSTAQKGAGHIATEQFGPHATFLLDSCDSYAYGVASSVLTRYLACGLVGRMTLCLGDAGGYPVGVVIQAILCPPSVWVSPCPGQLDAWWCTGPYTHWKSHLKSQVPLEMSVGRLTIPINFRSVSLPPFFLPTFLS